MVKDIAFSSYAAKDVAALRKFYADNLGLKFTGPFEQDGVLKYDEAQVGNSWFSVLTEEWHGIKPSGGVMFEVDDIERTVSDLRGKGLTVEEIYDTPVCRLTSFNDPEGNKVSLHQITVPH